MLFYSMTQITLFISFETGKNIVFLLILMRQEEYHCILFLLMTQIYFVYIFGERKNFVVLLILRRQKEYHCLYSF